jgi:hypothetical protein
MQRTQKTFPQRSRDHGEIREKGAEGSEVGNAQEKERETAQWKSKEDGEEQEASYCDRTVESSQEGS